jgi:hypothetical protein
MSFYHMPGVGMVHLNEVAPRRVVPAAERHKWSRIPKRGETARCEKCGCVKCYRLTYETVYRLADSSEILTERPACQSKCSLCGNLEIDCCCL